MDAFHWWMVRRNLAYAAYEGFGPVVARLRAQGYDAVADVVASQMPDTYNEGDK